MDEIKRKLALIDRQLAGRNFHDRMISTCPLVFPAIGLILGILIQSIIIESSVTNDGLRFFWLISLMLSVVSVVILFVFQRTGKLGFGALLFISLCTIVCFICFGAVRLAGFCKLQPNDICSLVTDEPKLATIRGLIITEPYVNKNRNWKFARFKPTDPTASFYLRTKEVEANQGWVKAIGTVRVQVDGPVLDLKAGDFIQAYCWLGRFSCPTNPGQFDTAGYLARRNVFIAASIKSRDGIELLRNDPADVFTKLKSRLRQWASRALLDNVSAEEPGRGLLEALLLGYRGNIDSETYRAFQKTGLLHFISLSGMHMGILVGIIWWLCKTAGLMKSARGAVCITAIIVFLMIVPPRAPTLRAAIISCIFCVSFFFRRYSSPINALSLAAIILLLIRPTQLFEAGWQLSFGTVLGILLFTERIHFFLYEKVTNLFRRIKRAETKWHIRVFSKPGIYFLKLSSVGLAAWLGGAGILLYHFYTITPLASLWTVLVLPLISAILVLGFMKMILFFLLPTLSSFLGFIVVFLSNFLIWFVKLFARADISQILIGHVHLAPIILYYCLILSAFFAYFKFPLLKKAVCIVMSFALFLYLGSVKWQRTHRDELVVTCLDVGHGQAIFAQLPGKANILFDAGSLQRSNIGGRVVVPFLNWAGVNKIDAVILSHSDTDHINGVPEIIEHCKVGSVYANDDFFDEADEWGTEKFLNDYLAQKGLEVKSFKEDWKLHSDAGLEMLWPDERAGRNEALSDNDKSLVTLMEFGGTQILLCSDIEKFAQRELLRLYSDLKAEIVVVPHHGSLNTLEPDFLKKLDAEVLIYSCDRRRYERLRVAKKETDSESFYTPVNGAIAINISDNGGIKAETFLP